MNGNPIVDELKDNYLLNEKGCCPYCGSKFLKVYYQPASSMLDTLTGEMWENYEGSEEIIKVVCAHCDKEIKQKGG